MTEIEFLSWVRGPGFQIATIIFVAGVIIRIAEILFLGRAANLAEPKGSEMGGGFRTIFTRSIPDAGTFRRSSLTLVAGYIFHIGLFVTIFLFAPHVLMFKDVVGIGWPSLPTDAKTPAWCSLRKRSASFLGSSLSVFIMAPV